MISGLAVLKNLQGLGIGEKLLTAAISSIMKDGKNVLCLNVENSNFRAINLYRKLGFREDGILKQKIIDTSQLFANNSAGNMLALFLLSSC